MPPKPKTTTIDPKERLRNWARNLWDAISNEGKYRAVHEDFFKEFNNLRDEGRDTWVMTLINYVAPIYDHIASQGYNAEIHYRPLKDAVTNFCEGRPGSPWEGPPDQISRTPSPCLPSSPPAGPSRKTHAANPDEYVPSDHDESAPESPKESVKPRKVTNAEGVESKSLPNTDGMERCPVKCSKCLSRKHGCHINPKATKSIAACFECNHWRLKCSLAANHANAKKGEEEAPPRATAAKKGEEEAPNEEEVAVKVPAPRRRKKPVQVPAAQPIGEPIFDIFDMADIFSLADDLAPEVLKKLENYESGRSLLLEKIEELSQAIARLAAENRSTREWFMSRLQMLWESASQRDATTAEALNNILEHALEMSRHFGLRDIGEKLEALIKVPESDVDPRQTLLPFGPMTSRTLPKPTLPKPTPKLTAVRGEEQPKKRGATDTPEGSHKRRKVQVF